MAAVLCDIMQNNESVVSKMLHNKTDLMSVPRAPHETSSTSSSCASGPASGSSGPGPDELGASDEVKIFKDEGEDDQDANGSEGSELQEEKSSLIIESEQTRFSDPRNFSYGPAFHVPGLSPLAMSPYFMGPYAYGSSLARSAFHHHPLTSSLDSTTNIHNQHPAFSSLTSTYPSQYTPTPTAPWADHFAAWHRATTSLYHQHQIATGSHMYPASALSLTATANESAAFQDVQSRIMAAAASAAVAADRRSKSLPHATHWSSQSNKVELDGKGKNGKTSINKAIPLEKNGPAVHRSGDAVHIKKPLNAFMLYMKETRATVQAECTLKESAAINQILGRRWHALSREEQAKFYEKSRMERQKHLLMYPQWNARDSFRYGFKKNKKRRRDKSSDETGGNMKRCRARYGMEEQELWCKPCRRKKKCIRIRAYISTTNTSTSPSVMDSQKHVSRDGGTTVVKSLSSLSNKSDESEGDDDEDDDTSSCTPSLIGSSGLIGGPRSIDSDTHSDLGAPLSPAIAFQPNVHASSSLEGLNDWLRHQHYSNTKYNIKQQNNIMTMMMMKHKTPPVGTDPRDSKNPLSVTQLTASSSNNGPIKDFHKQKTTL